MGMSMRIISAHAPGPDQDEGLSLTGLNAIPAPSSDTGVASFVLGNGPRFQRESPGSGVEHPRILLTPSIRQPGVRGHWAPACQNDRLQIAGEGPQVFRDVAEDQQEKS